MGAKKPNQMWQKPPLGSERMSYEYSTKSLELLDTCHPDIQKVFFFAIQSYNITIISGWRKKEEQDELFRTGKSLQPWPQSKHNFTSAWGKPASKAVDFAIWHPEEPHIHWQDGPSQMHIAGVILGIGLAMDVPLRSGCDWNENMDVRDNWLDCWHVEMKK
jgi:hypothetical protein